MDTTPAPVIDPRATRLLAFLTRWRDRLLQQRAQELSEHDFGQLVALNTILDYVHHEWD